MTRDVHDQFEYDVALSFAREDRVIVDKLGDLLVAKNIRVLYDDSQSAELGGSDFVTHVAELYRTRARYCVMLISQHYPLKRWTKAERTAAREHALRDADEYILPIQLDDTEVPGLTEVAGYRDLRESSVESIVNLLEQKLEETKGQASLPSKSHDLRSGNISSTQPKSDNE